MSATKWIIGVDIGGTNVVVGAVPVAGGEAFGVRRRSTESHRGAHSVISRVAEMVRATVRDLERERGDSAQTIAGVGVGAPGPLNVADGIVLESPNLGWENLPLRDLVSRAVGMPATLDNDANCATYGEWWMGAGRGVSTLVGVTIGTGVGGGLVVDGEIFHGFSDTAGEIGHMTIDFTGRRCACGNYGCLEAYASGPNIAARAIEGIEAGAETTLIDLVGGDLSGVTAATVYEAAAQGDPYADEVVRETAKILGAGIANVINLVNPEAVVIAGGVTRAGDHLMKPLRSVVRRRAFRSAADVCRIVLAELPEQAGMIGAAGVFRRTHGLGD